MTDSHKHITLSAKNYSQALIEIATEKGLNFKEISGDLDSVAEVLALSSDLRTAMGNPTFSDDVKIEIIDEIFTNKINKEILNFIKILIEKKRFDEFLQIKSDYESRLDEINNIKTVKIISAILLDETYRKQIVEKLKQKLNKEIRPIWQVDKNIIAGLIFKIDDNVIDCSIKCKLTKLQKNLM